MKETHSLANAVLMVPPKGFKFNCQTACDNLFQHQSELSEQQLRDHVMREYQQMVSKLRDASVQVVELDVDEVHQQCPDAVFPNNWLMTTRAGELHCFPMFTPNRQQEVKPELAMDKLKQSGFIAKRWVDYRNHFAGQTLEGTGAMILDHNHKRLFAALSERCDSGLLAHYCDQQGVKLHAFNTADQTGAPIYHTNVMLSIGRQTAIVCSNVICTEQRQTILDALQQTHQVIEITEQQMTEHFCANILQLRNSKNVPFWVMSESAYTGFSPQQIKQLESSGELLVNPIHRIEQVGGGSCRCMLAEVFLPASEKKNGEPS